MTVDLVFDTAVKSAILGVIAFWATRESGLAEARVGHRLWLAVLGSLVLLPMLSGLVPPVALVVPSARLAPASPAIPASVTRWAFYIYLAGMAVLLIRVAVGLLHVRGLFRRSISLDASDPAVAGLAVACAQAGARLVESAAVSVPSTAGVVQPRVILPSGWRDVDSACTRAAIRHELAHVRRSDYLVTVLVDVLCAIWWFHPVVWVGRRQVRWLAEVACDRDATTGEAQASYATALLRFARAGEPRLGFVLTATSALGRRVELLLGHSRPRSRGIRVAVVATVVLAALFMSARVSLSPRAASRLSPSSHTGSHVHAHGH